MGHASVLFRRGGDGQRSVAAALEDLTWMRNLNSAGGGVDEVELVVRELGRLHAAWWGDARLDQTPWLPMRGSLTPDQRLVALIGEPGVLSGQVEHSGY
jgi:hypothetical protein